MDGTYNDDRLKCPHCGYVDEDSWELSEEMGETECSSCDKPISYYTITTRTFVARPLPEPVPAEASR